MYDYYFKCVFKLFCDYQSFRGGGGSPDIYLLITTVNCAFLDTGNHVEIKTCIVINWKTKTYHNAYIFLSCLYMYIFTSLNVFFSYIVTTRMDGRGKEFGYIHPTIFWNWPQSIIKIAISYYSYFLFSLYVMTCCPKRNIIVFTQQILPSPIVVG